MSEVSGEVIQELFKQVKDGRVDLLDVVHPLLAVTEGLEHATGCRNKVLFQPQEGSVGQLYSVVFEQNGTVVLEGVTNGDEESVQGGLPVSVEDVCLRLLFYFDLHHEFK